MDHRHNSSMMDRMMDDFYDFDRRHRRMLSRHLDEPAALRPDDYDYRRSVAVSRPRPSLPTRMGDTTIDDNEREFKVNVNVESFAPEEVQVKVIDDREVSVEAKHEKKKDSDDGHGASSSYVCRHFSRSFTLPEGVATDDVRTNLGRNGILSISVPKPRPPMIESNERPGKVIPITYESSSSKSAEKMSK